MLYSYNDDKHIQYTIFLLYFSIDNFFIRFSKKNLVKI